MVDTKTENVKEKSNRNLFKIIKELFDHPAYRKDLEKNLRLTKSAVNYHLSNLKKYGLVEQIKDKRYAFKGYIDGQDAVVKTIKEWHELAFRYPSLEEIVNEVGLPIDKVQSIVYKTKEVTSWFMPNKAIIDSSSERLGEVLTCAARIRDNTFSESDYLDDLNIISDAKHYLECHPEMLPKLSIRGTYVISWPPMTLKYLDENYKPKERGIRGRKNSRPLAGPCSRVSF